jgi:hypothetical protein
MFFLAVVFTVLLSAASVRVGADDAQAADELPIFDTHLHYSQNSWETLTPREAIGKLKRINVPRAAVSSSPDLGTRRLYDEDSDRIVPILRPYHDDVNPGNWYSASKVIPYLENLLKTPDLYQGIGEFHLFNTEEVASTVVRQTLRLATEHGLYLHIHSDARVVRAVFTAEPKAKILWAHAGMTDGPDVVTKMLDEYQNLWVDTSYRESAIAPNGKLDAAWRALFLKHPDRITIGSDTWVPSRWTDYEQIIQFNRTWLAQLPRDVAEKIAFRNAVRLFGPGPFKQLQ